MSYEILGKKMTVQCFFNVALMNKSAFKKKINKYFCMHKSLQDSDKYFIMEFEKKKVRVFLSLKIF